MLKIHANLSSNTIGQYVFGAIAHESHESLNQWYSEIRTYYKSMMTDFSRKLKEKLPRVIVSSPDSSIYSVVDVRNIADPDFNSLDFVMYCAREGKIEIEGEYYTLLVSPMSGFYSMDLNDKNPGDTQMRISYVPVKDEMDKAPLLFASLFNEYNSMLS